MNKQILLILCGLILFIGGCGLSERDPAIQHAYMLNVTRNGDPVLDITDCIYVRPCRAAYPYAGRDFIYRLSPVQYEQDYYNQFLITPDSQVDEILSLWFRQSGIPTCTSATKLNKDELILTPRIDVLCVDFQETAKPEVILTMYFKLTRQEKAGMPLVKVFEKSYTAQSSLPPIPSGTQITEGMSIAMTEILTQMEKDVSATLK